ncbi:hypothetical protein CVV68_16925 [Arthrobacter livingstonensis]|uniref:HTH cro/C1-type domain-containing protein n=1 Tax=Arthrobacter livingstonensis TaxID=670078 RepID=A0A2V5LUS5_9MICC|nr:hypothetical protein [Arthrobacter livingstonensis]PYI65726.1 hypothetical protein CVV68_16925 [Arthrobacter livingstonensis]
MPDNENEAESAPSAQHLLARRLNLLLDVAAEERGEPLTFLELKEELAARGVGLSRARWSYMKDGTGHLVSDPELLAAISEVFGVDPDYLLGSQGPELPELIDSRLEFLKALRAAKVKSFAARALGEVSPETLRVITEYLNKDIVGHSFGKQLPATDQEDSGGGPPSIP